MGRLVNFVKYNKWVYKIYRLIGSFLINIAKIFIRKDTKMIVFVSYGGRKYDDSPKCIYERLVNDYRFSDFHFVWAFRSPEKYSIPLGKKVKIDTLSYYKCLLKAGCWITNSSVERGLALTPSRTLYLNSWHGSPIKKLGRDTLEGSSAFGKSAGYNFDIMLAQSHFDVKVFSAAYGISKNKFRIIGLPRNDELTLSISADQSGFIKKKLRIYDNRKVILYAPTYREYDRTDDGQIVPKLPFHIDLWRQTLSSRYVLLFRAHYEVAKLMNITEDGFIKDVSGYEKLNDLLMISDILVSDYSSIFFDFSILHRPMYSYCYDYEKYSSTRGVYFDIREWLPYALDERGILSLLENEDKDSDRECVIRFQQNFVEEYGNASLKSVDILAEHLL